jgi:hypothetical protein
MENIPTETGDVLILRTEQSFRVYAVAVVTQHGQQEFNTAMPVEYVNTSATALARAKALVRPEGRVFLRNIDTNEWSEIREFGDTPESIAVAQESNSVSSRASSSARRTRPARHSGFVQTVSGPGNHRAATADPQCEDRDLRRIGELADRKPALDYRK